MSDRITESWDHNAARWTDAVRGGLLESRKLVTDHAIVDAVLCCNGKRILDVGCGEGWLARRLVAEGREVVGFDASTELIERARSAGGGAFVAVSYEQFQADPTAVGTGFDIAVCNFSILTESIQPLLRALAQVAHTVVIQTVHPLTTLGDFPYTDGWREEKFEHLPGQWAAMPWFYRTLSSWSTQLHDAK